MESLLHGLPAHVVDVQEVEALVEAGRCPEDTPPAGPLAGQLCSGYRVDFIGDTGDGRWLFAAICSANASGVMVMVCDLDGCLMPLTDFDGFCRRRGVAKSPLIGGKDYVGPSSTSPMRTAQTTICCRVLKPSFFWMLDTALRTVKWLISLISPIFS